MQHQCYLLTFNELYKAFFCNGPCCQLLENNTLSQHKLGLCTDLDRNPLANDSNCNSVPPLQFLPGYKRCPDQTLNLQLQVVTDQPHRPTIALGLHTVLYIPMSSRCHTLHSLPPLLPAQLIPPAPNLIHPREIHSSPQCPHLNLIILCLWTVSWLTPT